MVHLVGFTIEIILHTQIVFYVSNSRRFTHILVNNSNTTTNVHKVIVFNLLTPNVNYS